MLHTSWTKRSANSSGELNVEPWKSKRRFSDSSTPIATKPYGSRRASLRKFSFLPKHSTMHRPSRFRVAWSVARGNGPSLISRNPSWVWALWHFRVASCGKATASSRQYSSTFETMALQYAGAFALIILALRSLISFACEMADSLALSEAFNCSMNRLMPTV